MACFCNPDSVAEVTTMVRAAHLRNLLEASLKVRSMCEKLDSVLRSKHRFSMYSGKPGRGFSILISLQIGM